MYSNITFDRIHVLTLAGVLCVKFEKAYRHVGSDCPKTRIACRKIARYS